MSTAGKVLTILVLLMMVVWLVMLAPVIQNNLNYGKKIQDQGLQITKLEAQAKDLANSVLTLTESARLEQDAENRDVRELLIRISTAERRQSSTIQSLTRLKVQLTDYLVAVEQAKVNLATREAEQAKAEEDLAKTKDLIAKAQGSNADLRGTLTQLQEDFKRLLAENAAKVQSGRTAVPASSRRPSPAS